MLHINNIFPRLVKMPPKIPPAWPQNVQRHLALRDRIHGASHLSDYLAGTDANPVMDVRIGQLLDMRNTASERRQGVIASAVEAGASSVEAPASAVHMDVEAPASAVHMEAAGSSSGGGDPMVDFMPPLPSSTFKRLFKTCKSKAKPQAIDLSDDEVVPSASASSGQGGEASMDTGGEAAEETGAAEETEAAEETWGSRWSEDDLQSWRDLQHASEASR